MNRIENKYSGPLICRTMSWFALLVVMLGLMMLGQQLFVDYHAAAAVAALPPLPPHTIYGVVTIDGTPAADGTLLQVLITRSATETVSVSIATFSSGGQSGYYSIALAADNGNTAAYDGGQAGDVISFAVGGTNAVESAAFASGTTQALNLTITSPTATPTNTSIPPTATHTNTPIPPTATDTNTPIPPTATDTNTPIPPTATNTNTPIPPTATDTNTPIPPTATDTNTPIPPTATDTNTPIPPTATNTNTPIPPTATDTNTPIPPTATHTNTPIPPTATHTNTPIPPTATKTNTPLPPTATPTATPTTLSSIVTNLNDSGTGSLRFLVDTAQDGETITFAPTLSNGTIRLASEIIIFSNIMIDGGALNISVSGDSNGDGNGDVRLLIIAATDVTIKNLTFTKGNAGNEDGGMAIVAEGAQLTLDHVSARQNKAGNNGGAIENSGTLVVRNSQWISNSAGSLGGAINNWAGVLSVQDSQFQGNTSNYGGGIALYNNAEGSLLNATFSLNRANNEGGGIQIAGSKLTGEGLTLRNNSAQTNAGGALHAWQSTLTLTRTEMVSNTARYGGGLAIRNGGVTALNEVTISDNYATDTAGGILNENSSMNVARSSVVNNRSVRDAGGIQNMPNATLNLVNSTVGGNTTPGWGGGIRHESNSKLSLLQVTLNGNSGNSVGGGNLHLWNATAVMSNTILANALSGRDCSRNGSSTVTGIGSLIEDASCTADFTGDPQLAALALNDGTTLNYAPLASSPAINSGNGAVCVALDQGGQVRPVGSGCDLGAIEFAQSDPLLSADQANTNEDTAVTINVLANDNARNNAGLQLVGIGTPQNGTATISGNSIRYTPTLNFDGADAFTYQAFNGALTSTAQVAVIIAPINDAPLAVNDSFNAAAGVSQNLNVLSNDSDPDRFTTLTIVAVGTPNQGGQVTIGNNAIQYKAAAGFNGSEQFNYTLSDGVSQANATVTINVLQANCFATFNDGGQTFASADAQAVRDAIAAAAAGNTVKVAGNCSGAVSENGSTQVARISKNLTLQGGYNPAGNWATSDPLANPTNLDGAQGGRVIYIGGGEVTLVNLTIRNGKTISGEHGGAIFAGGNKVTVRNVQVLNNRAFNGGGGGIYGTTTLVIEDSLLANNIADVDGGAIYKRDSFDTTIRRSTLRDNRAISGGGVRHWGGKLTIEQSTLFSNTATSDGGALFLLADADIINSTISGNKAKWSGAGIYIWCCWNGKIKLLHSTISNNDSNNNVNVYNRSTLIVENSILANPTRGEACSNTATTVITGTINLIEGGGSCLPKAGFTPTTLITSDPALAPLQNNGGKTVTHALLSGSPAINVGSAAACQTQDQRGTQRDSLCDLGAFEAAMPDLALDSITADSQQVCLQDAINVGVLLHNHSDLAAGAFNIYLYDDASGDGFNNLVLQRNISGIAGGHIHMPLSLSLQAAFTGTRYLKVVADGGNAIFESSESNNSQLLLVNVRNQPAPHGTLLINNDARYATNKALNLAISPQIAGTCLTQPTQMRFYANGAYSNWEPFNASKSLTVTGSDGDSVTVYVQLQDAAGHESGLIGDTITLDLLPPDSRVTAPAGKSAQTFFDVFWTGIDATSGMASFDVQVRTNDGNWIDWQSAITRTVATYSNAQFGSSYCFRSRGTDVTGQREAYPSDSDTCVTVQPPLVGRDLTVQRLEFTQAAQDAGNSVALVAGRPLLVRATLGTGTTITGVTGLLHALRNGVELPGSPIAASNAPITAKPNPNRNNGNDLLHWQLPMTWLSGTVQVYVEIDPANTVVEDNDTNNRFPATGLTTLNFVETRDMEIIVVPFRYRYSNGTVKEPSQAEIQAAMKHMMRIFPIKTYQLLIHAPLDLTVVPGTDTSIVQMNATQALRSAEALPFQRQKFYYGISPEWGAGGWGEVGGNVAAGGQWDGVVWQELGHAFGLLHAPCGVTPDNGPDLNYPYPGGVIGNAAWDNASNQILAASMADYMSYCRPNHTSDYAYRFILNKLRVNQQNEQASAADSQQGEQTSAATELFIVNGTLAADGKSGALAPIFRIGNPALVASESEIGAAHAADSSSGSGAYHMALVNAAGEEFFIHTFDMPTLGRPSGKSLRFAEIFAAQNGVIAVRFYYKEFLLDELLAGAMPSVNITSAAPGTLTTQYMLKWSGSAGAAYLVRYSANNGSSWQVLATGITTTQLAVDPAYLKGTAQGLFEVIASNGINNAIAKLGPFNVPSKAPQAFITSHSTTETLVYNGSDAITFIGNASDLEDGGLSGASLAWSSDKVGQLGTGNNLVVQNLAVGKHQITLVATDSNGQKSQQMVTVEVLDPTTIASTAVIAAPGIYSLGNTGAVVEVVSTGGCLERITARLVNQVLANVNFTVDGNRYWTLEQTGCDENAVDGNSYFVHLTLPTTAQPDERFELCRYAATSAQWDCAATRFDATDKTVTRETVTHFSTWVVRVTTQNRVFLPTVMK